MLQSGRHLPGTHPRFYLLTITYSVYVCNNSMLKCSCFCRQSTIEHRHLEPVEILINRRKNQTPPYCRLSLMWSRYLEYSVIFMSINLLISRFFEILNNHNNNILATEILIFWKKNSLYSITWTDFQSKSPRNGKRYQRDNQKDKQYTGQTKKDQRRNRDLKNIALNTKDRATLSHYIRW